MNKKHPLVSFVVLSWNTKEDTLRCIESIRDAKYDNKQLVVVDNGSNDGSKEMLREQTDIVFIDLPKNTGFTGGQIRGLKACDGEYIALINSDAVIADDWTSVCLETFGRHKKAAVVGGKAFLWNEQYSLYDTKSPYYSYQKIDLRLGYAETYQSGELEIEVDSISGAGVMIRREAIDAVGYFDDTFFAYFEETDLFARMQRAGYVVVYQPKAHIWHQIAKSSKGKPYFYLYQMHRNRFLFGLKNLDRGSNFVFAYIGDGIRALKAYRRDRDDLESKARSKALLWNLRNLPRTYFKRRSIEKLGPTYSNLVSAHRPGNDVTVIVPSYNYSKYLPETLRSIFQQTHKPMRVIVIDDGSTDKSPDIARSFSPENIEYEVIAKKNEGVVKTKNLGIELSKTSWTLFLDADDVLEENYIESTLATAKKFNVDVVYTDMTYFGKKSGTFIADHFSEHRLLKGNFIHNSALINTTLLKRVGGYKEAMYDGYEDWELYLTLSESGAKFAKNTKTRLLYRQHADSLSRNKQADSNGEKIMAKALSFHEAYSSRVHQEQSKTKRAIRLIARHPVVILVAIIMLPLSAIVSIKDYVRTVRIRFVHYVRTYLHKKNYTKYKSTTEHPNHNI